MTSNTRIDLLFGDANNPKGAGAKTAVRRPGTHDAPGLLASHCTPPKDFRCNDALYRKIRTELAAEFSSSSFVDQAEVDGLAQDYLWLMEYRKMWEQAARPLVGLTHEQERKWQRCQQVQRVWPVVLRILACQEPPSQILCSLEEASAIAREIRYGIQRAEAYFDDEEAEEEADDALDPADMQHGEEPAVEAHSPQNEATLSPQEKRELAYLDSLGAFRQRLQDDAYVVKLLSEDLAPSMEEWTAILQVLEHEQSSIEAWTKPDESLQRALQQIKQAADAAQLANAEKLILLEHRVRKTEEVIAGKLRRLRRR